MLSCFIAGFIALTSFSSTQAQADALLSFAPMGLWEDRIRVTFDESGCLWLAYRGVGTRRDIYAARINRSGKTEVGPVLVYQDKKGDPEYPILGYRIACDRWDNAYFIYAISGAMRTGYAHLIRVTPEGDVNSYDPWPEKQRHSLHYIDILPGDTLLLFSPYDGGGGRMAKALIKPDNITPVHDSLYSKGSFPISIGMKIEAVSDYLDWENRFGLKVKVWGDDMRIIQISLKPEDNYKSNELGPYSWRDYIWRSYPDAPIAYPTWTRFKDNGFVLCFPDPQDTTTTQVVRLDEEGLPIDPSTLDKGGTRSARSFNNLPSSAEPNVDFWIWRTHRKRTPRDSYFVLDSALVRFWGCDDEGNLYNYTQLRKY